MSLARALARLPEDRLTEGVIRDVLSLFQHHPGEWLSESDVVVKTGHPSGEVSKVVRVMTESFVLESRGEPATYRLVPGAVLTYEIEGYMRRVQSHRDHVETNIARFRERYGG